MSRYQKEKVCTKLALLAVTIVTARRIPAKMVKFIFAFKKEEKKPFLAKKKSKKTKLRKSILWLEFAGMFMNLVAKILCLLL